jgi:hypothetical protein
MFHDITTPVLVAEDTTFARERYDHAARILMLQRPQKHLAASAPIWSLLVPRPSPVLFEDRFVSVYPVLEVFSQKGVPPPAQPFSLTFRPSTRLDEPQQEDQFHRVDQTTLFRFILQKSQPINFLGFTFEIPDLCDNPWLEWVHPAPTPESLMYPFRQIYPPSVKPTPINLLYWASPNWRLEAEIYAAQPIEHGARFYPFHLLPAQPQLEFSDGLSIYDGLNGTVTLQWGPFWPPTPTGYDVYQRTVTYVPVYQPPSGAFGPSAGAYTPQFGPWQLLANLSGTTLIYTATGLQIASYNAASQVVTPSQTYEFRVVAVSAGQESGVVSQIVTPGPQSISLVTPMKRLWPFPNTGLD